MKKSFVSAVLALCLIASPSAANYVLPMSLRDQYAVADVVILVRTGQNELCTIHSGTVPCVELTDPVYLKGNNSRPGEMRHLITHNPIRELAVDCCDPGSTYLMFLKAYENQLYPLRGHWSIIRVDRPGDLPIN